MSSATTPGQQLETSQHEDVQPLSLGLLEIGVILRQKLRLLIAGPILAGVAAYGLSFLLPPTYTATTTFLPPQQQGSAAAALSSLGALAGLTGASSLKSPTEQYVALMESVSVSDRIIDHFQLMKVYGAEYRVDARKTLATKVDISIGKKDGLVSVAVQDEKPERAADIANAYIDELKLISSTLAVSEAQQRRVFFEAQLQSTKAKLTLAQRELEGAGYSERVLRAEPRAAAESYARLQAEITTTEVAIQTLRRSYNENSPELQQALTRLQALRAQLTRLENSAQAPAEAVGKPDYIGAYREFKYQEALFELMSKQYELARVDESREGALIQVVDKAMAPERRTKPVRSLIALLSMLATAILLAAVILTKALAKLSKQDELLAKRTESLIARLKPTEAPPLSHSKS